MVKALDLLPKGAMSGKYPAGITIAPPFSTIKGWVLPIARRSALLCGGDLQTLRGELGGAAFRVILASARNGVAS